jgi:hypothetical protein
MTTPVSSLVSRRPTLDQLSLRNQLYLYRRHRFLVRSPLDRLPSTAHSLNFATAILGDMALMSLEVGGIHVNSGSLRTLEDPPLHAFYRQTNFGPEAFRVLGKKQLFNVPTSVCPSTMSFANWSLLRSSVSVATHLYARHIPNPYNHQEHGRVGHTDHVTNRSAHMHRIVFTTTTRWNLGLHSRGGCRMLFTCTVCFSASLYMTYPHIALVLLGDNTRDRSHAVLGSFPSYASTRPLSAKVCYDSDKPFDLEACTA